MSGNNLLESLNISLFTCTIASPTRSVVLLSCSLAD